MHHRAAHARAYRGPPTRQAPTPAGCDADTIHEITGQIGRRLAHHNVPGAERASLSCTTRYKRMMHVGATQHGMEVTTARSAGKLWS